MTDAVEIDDVARENIYKARHVHGLPPERRLVPYRNIRQLLSQHAKTSPGAAYLVFVDKDSQREQLSYAEFNARVHQVANFLHDDLGVRRGDRVATIAHNHSDTVLIYFACWVIGACVAPQNVTEDDRRIAFILRNSEAKVVLVRSDYMERAERIIHGTDDGLGAPNIEHVVQVGGEPSEEYPHFHTLVKNLPYTYLGDGAPVKSADDMVYLNERVPSLDDEALLVYTSGTTGAPKGVVLTQYSLLVDAYAICSAQGITGNQRLMCVLPIHHVNGIVVTLVTPLMAGASVVLNRQFSVSTFWRMVVQEKINIVSVVPTLLQFLLEQAREQQAAGNPIFGEGIHRRGLTHFRHFVCGAGTLAVALAREFEDTFGFPILHGYGLSETTCYSCFMPIDIPWEEQQRWLQEHGYPSIGMPVIANEMAIFDAEGNQLSEGERGEICVRGHNVMTGYFKRPDANAETFKFGWFRSGDEGFYLTDERGRQFFFISGRLKELINRGGVKFSPFDIEEVMLSIPGVKVALAVAFKNDYYGEEVGAFIVKQEDAELDEETVIRYCRERMTFEKSPKAVVFGTEVPVTTTGKYQRLKLQDLFADYQGMQFRK